MIGIFILLLFISGLLIVIALERLTAGGPPDAIDWWNREPEYRPEPRPLRFW
jgi:hypothetical protein